MNIACQVLLNIVTGLSWPWFGPIANNGRCFIHKASLCDLDVLLAAADFNITLDDVNWLGNILSCIYLPTSLLMPTMVSKYGINRCVSVQLSRKTRLLMCAQVPNWSRVSDFVGMDPIRRDRSDYLWESGVLAAYYRTGT